MNILKYVSYAAAGVMLMTSCNKSGNPDASNPGNYSTKTGAEYNEEAGFQVADFEALEEGTVFIFF